jgi:hypothetical protein
MCLICILSFSFYLIYMECDETRRYKFEMSNSNRLIAAYLASKIIIALSAVL